MAPLKPTLAASAFALFALAGCLLPDGTAQTELVCSPVCGTYIERAGFEPFTISVSLPGRKFTTDDQIRFVATPAGSADVVASATSPGTAIVTPKQVGKFGIAVYSDAALDQNGAPLRFPSAFGVDVGYTPVDAPVVRVAILSVSWVNGTLELTLGQQANANVIYFDDLGASHLDGVADWAVTGGVATLSSTTGTGVVLTPAAAGNGALTATIKGVQGSVLIHVVP